MSRRISPTPLETPSATGPGQHADAHFTILETPITKLKSLIARAERPVQLGEDRTKVTLTQEQLLACTTFAHMVSIAWEAYRAQFILENELANI